MEFEYWWLLGFPLFFGLGWLAARVDIRQLMSESRTLPKSYFKGLNFLLNEQPDKAIEAFIEVVKVDKETVDVHSAIRATRAKLEFCRTPCIHGMSLDSVADCKKRMREHFAAMVSTSAVFNINANIRSWQTRHIRISIVPPLVAPAPTIMCNSSMKSTAPGVSCNASSTPLKRSSKSPR